MKQNILNFTIVLILACCAKTNSFYMKSSINKPKSNEKNQKPKQNLENTFKIVPKQKNNNCLLFNILDFLSSKELAKTSIVSKILKKFILENNDFWPKRNVSINFKFAALIENCYNCSKDISNEYYPTKCSHCNKELEIHFQKYRIPEYAKNLFLYFQFDEENIIPDNIKYNSKNDFSKVKNLSISNFAYIPAASNNLRSLQSLILTIFEPNVYKNIGKINAPNLKELTLEVYDLTNDLFNAISKFNLKSLNLDIYALYSKEISNLQCEINLEYLYIYFGNDEHFNYSNIFGSNGILKKIMPAFINLKTLEIHLLDIEHVINNSCGVLNESITNIIIRSEYNVGNIRFLFKYFPNVKKIHLYEKKISYTITKD